MKKYSVSLGIFALLIAHSVSAFTFQLSIQSRQSEYIAGQELQFDVVSSYINPYADDTNDASNRIRYNKPLTIGKRSLDFLPGHGPQSTSSHLQVYIERVANTYDHTTIVCPFHLITLQQIVQQEIVGRKVSVKWKIPINLIPLDTHERNYYTLDVDYRYRIVIGPWKSPTFEIKPASIQVSHEIDYEWLRVGGDIVNLFQNLGYSKLIELSTRELAIPNGDQLTRICISGINALVYCRELGIHRVITMLDQIKAFEKQVSLILQTSQPQVLNAQSAQNSFDIRQLLDITQSKRTWYQKISHWFKSRWIKLLVRSGAYEQKPIPYSDTMRQQVKDALLVLDEQLFDNSVTMESLKQRFKIWNQLVSSIGKKFDFAGGLPLVPSQFFKNQHQMNYETRLELLLDALIPMHDAKRERIGLWHSVTGVWNRLKGYRRLSGVADSESHMSYDVVLTLFTVMTQKQKHLYN
ncbi:hypothetical protein MP228_010776 [Amoeboaphelidium protococcarum]|nr:hypothetical protein MP228_010776 [Amoeboaphelidium protococcarum]